MKRHIHILYIGDDVIIRDNHPIKKWQGKVALKSNTLYKLSAPWYVHEINGHCVFYIYDDLGGNESRGYEINVKDVKPLRDYNLDKLGIN
jgi:hypothetical protein